MLKFSVSMCVYGGDDAAHFDEALKSVYHQTCPPDEVVLVVDGPVCAAIDQVIGRYPALKVIRLPENTGHGNARRVGFEHCSYDYIAIADADDINVQTRFEKQLRCFESDAALSAVSSGCCHFVGSADNVVREEVLARTDDEIKRYLKKRCPLCQASVMLKKADVERAGGYRDWYHAEDYYLWVRMYLCGCRFYNVEESLVYVRSNPEQSQRRGGLRYYRSMRDLFRYMRKHGIISWPQYVYNTASRFVMQLLLPNRVRMWIRQKAL